MYVNQIDNIIDNILDNLYLDGLSNDLSFKTIRDGNKVNFVEYRDKINLFIEEFIGKIDKNSIQKIINNQENLERIIDIIKRYVAYYYFLSIAYYYTGQTKDFRNNLIQYSKLQDNSKYRIKNFFDTENNYQIILFYKIIKDVSKILVMTDLQKQTLNYSDVKDAIIFLNKLGKDYIDNYLLTIVQGENVSVEINVHNLIKTIVFGEIYRTQDQKTVFEILNDVKENKNEYTYIDIVVVDDKGTDLEELRQIFAGNENMAEMAEDLQKMINDLNKDKKNVNLDKKNNNLFEIPIVLPIVDDFLRYHRDSERLDVEGEKNIIIPTASNNNAKNIKLALLYQQRKKKENTKAQQIVNKIDVISDYYSDNVKNNPEIQKDIKKYFQGPLEYRKAVLHNYNDEVFVMSKFMNQSKKFIETNEYFLELRHTISNAYFNFKDFKKYGTSVFINTEKSKNLLRYSNIEYKNQLAHEEVDTHTITNGSPVHVVGLAVGPFDNIPMQCVKKENIVDIRSVNISYMKNKKVINKVFDNGYKGYLKIIKYFYVETLRIDNIKGLKIYNDYTEIRKLNSNIFDKIIYWIYDIDKDSFKMDTYENIKTQNYQDVIKYMNAIMYDKIAYYFAKRLEQLIENNVDLSSDDIELLIETYASTKNLSYDQQDKREMIIKKYLKNKVLDKSTVTVVDESERLPMAHYAHSVDSTTLKIKIDMKNPTKIKQKVSRTIDKDAGADAGETKSQVHAVVETTCQHNNEWSEVNRLRNFDLNKYNLYLTNFIQRFAIETSELNFVCRVCGEILPMKQYVQDGSFDNNTQRFITAYVPSDMPLEEMKEYSKYSMTIRYLDALINRVSLITNTNMFAGNNVAVKQKRRVLVKNIFDLIVKHNAVNLAKKIDDNDRLEFYHKKFNIIKELDNVYFFEIDDSMFDSNQDLSANKVEFNRLKLNNVYLYFILMFITELNGAQISMMASNKIANIYTYLNYGPKLFDNLRIKTNIDDVDTAPIVEYPVLCYLIFMIAYYLIEHKVWHYPAANNKKFNPVYQKIIINSIVDLFNSISIDAGHLKSEYIYMITASKLYSQLNKTFKNNDIINILKQNHIKYSGDKTQEIVKTDTDKNKYPRLSIDHPIKIEVHSRIIPDFKLTSGIQFDDKEHIVWDSIEAITDFTNCPTGSYHKWEAKGKSMICKICGENNDEVTGKVDRSIEAYYFNLQQIAEKRCLIGTLHDFQTVSGTTKCTICKKSPDEKYTRAELDKLKDVLDRLEGIRAAENINATKKQEADYKTFEKTHQVAYEKNILNYKRYIGEPDGAAKIGFGKINIIADKFIDAIESYIGNNADVDTNKYPVYLKDNVFIIDHTYNELLKEPILLSEKENKVMLKDNHPYFKTDVYYYSNNRLQTDIFYDARTLKMLGYKEKHKEYTSLPSSTFYLKINPSIKNRLINVGFETKYINIENNLKSRIANANAESIENVDANERYFKILDDLVKDHVLKNRAIIHKFKNIIFKIRNYIPPTETQTQQATFLYATQTLDKIIFKYSKLLKNFNVGANNDAFSEWDSIADSFVYEKVNWEETDVRMMNDTFVNSDIINYYDTQSILMMYYLTQELVKIVDSNDDKVTKINLCQMFIDVLTYIYNLYNVDRYKNIIEIKRFDFIMNGSEFTLDVLRKSQRVTAAKQVEDDLIEMQEDADTIIEEDELEDLREEAEALDIDTDYYAEEDQDYAGEGDYSE